MLVVPYARKQRGSQLTHTRFITDPTKMPFVLIVPPKLLEVTVQSELRWVPTMYACLRPPRRTNVDLISPTTTVTTSSTFTERLLGPISKAHEERFFGVRLKLQIHNAANAAVYFNGDTSKTITNLGNTDVTSMFVTFTSNGTEEALSITFPSKYNIGTTASPNPTESKDVKIRISPQGVNGLWVDYLFDASDFQTKDKWFLYDPTMVAGDKATVSAAAASQNSANSGGGGGNSSSSSQASSASSIRNGIVAFVTAALVSSWASTL